MNEIFLAQLLADGGPLVFPGKEFVPVFFGFFPGDEFMQRGDVEHHAIVEVGFQMQVGCPTQFVLEVPQRGK